MGKVIRERLSNEIVYLFTQKGMNLSGVAETLKINRRDVKIVLVQNNLYQESKIFFKNEPELSEFIINLYENEGKSIREISRLIKHSTNSISKVLKDKLVLLRKAGNYNRKYTSDDSAFINQTPESVYWAGFVAGDGCVYSHGLSDKSINNCLNVGLSIVDKDHLLNFKEFLKYDGQLYVSENKVALNINNVNIVKSLENIYLISNNKTNNYSPPENIPPHLIKYFILGLLDSDGSISKCRRPSKTKVNYKGAYIFQVNFTGTKESCEYVKRYFGSNVKLSKRHKNNTNNYTIVFQGNNQLIEYLSRIYDANSIKFCLKRKYKMYIELVEQYSDKSSILET